MGIGSRMSLSTDLLKALVLASLFTGAADAQITWLTPDASPLPPLITRTPRIGVYAYNKRNAPTNLSDNGLKRLCVGMRPDPRRH
jgi:hypothetical protein